MVVVERGGGGDLGQQLAVGGRPAHPDGPPGVRLLRCLVAVVDALLHRDLRPAELSLPVLDVVAPTAHVEDRRSTVEVERLRLPPSVHLGRGLDLVAGTLRPQVFDGPHRNHVVE